MLDVVGVSDDSLVVEVVVMGTSVLVVVSGTDVTGGVVVTGPGVVEGDAGVVTAGSWLVGDDGKASPPPGGLTT